MILDSLFKFDWKIQNIGEKPNFLDCRLSEDKKQTFAVWTSRVLHNMCYRGGNSGFSVKSYVDTVMPVKPPFWYYLNLTGGVEHSIYFFESFQKSYCFDKEVFKLYWSKYAWGKDDNYTQEKVMYDILTRMKGHSTLKVDWDNIQIDKATMDEIQALIWLCLVGAYFAAYNGLENQTLQEAIRDKKNWYQGIHNIFERKDLNLVLFRDNPRFNNKTQLDTYINPDYFLFDGFMMKFMETYDIDKGLWGLFLQKTFELRHPENVLLGVWEEALSNWWMQNENNYGFFYLLWKHIGCTGESKFKQFLSGNKSFNGLYEELKKREMDLVLNYSRAETVFAYMAVEFFSNFFYIIWWHNEIISSPALTKINTKNRFSVIMGDWMNIIYEYTQPKKWFKYWDKKPIFSVSDMPHKTFFSNTMRNVPFLTIWDNEFEKTHNQVDIIAVTKVLDQNKSELNPVDWYPVLIRLYSQNKFKLDNAIADREWHTTSKAEDAKNINWEKLNWLDNDELNDLNAAMASARITLKDWRKVSVDEYKQMQQKITEEAKQEDFNAQLPKEETPQNVEEIEEEVFSNLFSEEELYEALKKQIFGQDALLKHISEKIYSYLVLKKCNDKPLTFFLVWPPGTWKTYLSEVLVKVLNEFIRDPERQFNAQSEMATNYQDSATLSKLLGASASYAGHGDKITFFEELLKKKNQIILFDEIEKGSPALYPFFLDFMNNGKFETNDGQYGIYMGDPNEISYLPKGEKVHQLENCILIFASNAITSEKQVIELSEDKKFKAEQDVEKFGKTFIQQNRTLRTALQNWRGNKNAMMDRAFLDRLQLIYLFNNLSEEYLKEIVINKFEKLLKSFKVSPDEKQRLILKFKVWFMKSTEVKNMKNAHSMRELQAIIEDWISRSIIELRKQNTKILKKQNPLEKK